MHACIGFVADLSFWPQLLEEGKIVLVGEANEDSPTSEVGWRSVCVWRARLVA